MFKVVLLWFFDFLQWFIEMLIGLNESIFEGKIDTLLIEDEKWSIANSFASGLWIHEFDEGIHSHD